MPGNWSSNYSASLTAKTVHLSSQDPASVLSQTPCVRLSTSSQSGAGSTNLAAATLVSSQVPVTRHSDTYSDKLPLSSRETASSNTATLSNSTNLATASQLSSHVPVTRHPDTYTDKLPLSSHGTASSITSHQVSTVQLWNNPHQPLKLVKAAINHSPVPRPSKPPNYGTKLTWSRKLATPIESVLPFDDCEDLGDHPAPVKPILKPGKLRDMYFTLPDGKVFSDKVLPSPDVELVEHESYNAMYFLNLHRVSSAPGERGQYKWPEYTPNYIGVRVPLVHTSFNLDRWRYHLTGYHSPELIQFLEFGFPMGLDKLPNLSPALSNHGSAYQFFPWLDSFFASGLLKGGVTGPFGTSPFSSPMVSPLMTAAKKPAARRAVYDATYGNYSLNKATPCETYLGTKTVYTYPKVDDFRDIILRCGAGCFLWKRDLSRYYLQLPLDPTEYRFTGTIWRGFFFFFTSLMFGLRNSGLQGQKVTDAVTWVHRNLGLEYCPPSNIQSSSEDSHTRHAADQPSNTPLPVQQLPVTRNSAIAPIPQPLKQTCYNSINYSDDLGGGESTHHKAESSFTAMGELFRDLGLAESLDKACAPSTSMVYLGVKFNTVDMTMSVPPEKVQEVRADLEVWCRKTTAVRKDLQSLLGKLFWISRVVKHSRAFMSRLLQLLRDMKGLPDSRRVPLSEDSRKDILWWHTYLRTFNGVCAMYNDYDNLQSYEQLLSSPYKVCAGDATLHGAGAWYAQQYWSRVFPSFLRPREIAVHVKEFWTVICSCWVWGDEWAGDIVFIFCDNDSVVDTIVNQRPKDQDMCTLLREFLYVVCLKRFSPIARKIDTKTNLLADHISRCYDHESADKLFTLHGKPGMVNIPVEDFRFKLSAPW